MPRRRPSATERESRARIEARLEAARQRLGEEIHRIREILQCEPDGCLALAQFPDGAPLPALRTRSSGSCSA